MKHPSIAEVFSAEFFARILDACPQRRLAVDGGAHLGVWTNAMAQEFDDVLAFEPGAHARPGAVRAALGAAIGRCALADGPDNTGQSHIVPGDDVQILTLDALRLDAVDLLKLDVEGYELFALRGAEGTIDRCHPAVVVELNGLAKRYGSTDAAVDDWLKARGYIEIATNRKDHLYAFRNHASTQ